MSIILLIIGIIVVSWLIALCFKDFRDKCIDLIPEIFSDFYKMYKEDDTSGILYKIFLINICYSEFILTMFNKIVMEVN